MLSICDESVLKPLATAHYRRNWQGEYGFILDQDCNVKSMTYLVFTNCTIQWCFCNQNEYVSSTWQAAAGLHSSFIALLIALIKWAGQRATIKIFLPEKNLKFHCWYERLLLFSWPKMEHFCLHFLNREQTQKLIEFLITN